MDWSRRFEQMFADNSDAPDRGHTQIGAGAHIFGDVISSESVELAGHITGRLVSSNGPQKCMVLVKAHGSLEGQLVGDSVTILGHVQGTVRSEGVLQLGADARVQADLGYGDLYIEPGAVIQGVLSHVGPSALVAPAQFVKA